MIDEELRAFLLQFPGVVAEVAGRVYPAPLPQGAELPAVTYSDISDVGDHTGPDGAGAYHRMRYQIDHWAQTRQTARRLDQTVRTVMDGYRGKWGGRTIGGALRKSSRTLGPDDAGLWRAISDYEIHILC